MGLNVNTILPDYVVDFSLDDDYDGEFGFDWMREDWITSENPICTEGVDDFKKKYKSFGMDIKNSDGVPYGNYYAPWLTMFPNHKEKIGKPVKLKVGINWDFMGKIPANEEFEFVSGNPNITIEPSKMNVDDSLTAGGVIEIKNNTPTEETFIEVKGSNGAIVGKLNISKNAHYQNLTINIPIVKAYVSDKETHNKSVIDTELQKASGLKEIEKFLNTKSLNQALIQVKFQYDKDKKPYDWPFRVQSLKTANIGINPRTNEEEPYYLNFKGMIKDKVNFKFDSG